MNRIFAKTLGVVIMGAALAAAPQKPAQTAAAADKGTGQTFVGCLEPGTNGGYTLMNAQEKGGKSKDKVNFLVVASSPKLDLEANVTKAVEITGTLAGSAKDGALPTLTVTKVKWHADYCGVPVPH